MSCKVQCEEYDNYSRENHLKGEEWETLSSYRLPYSRVLLLDVGETLLPGSICPGYCFPQLSASGTLVHCLSQFWAWSSQVSSLLVRYGLCVQPNNFLSLLHACRGLGAQRLLFVLIWHVLFRSKMAVPFPVQLNPTCGELSMTLILVQKLYPQFLLRQTSFYLRVSVCWGKYPYRF